MSRISIQQAIDLAMQHQQAGQLQQAESIYRQILAVQPNNAVAMHQLGLLALQVGKINIAVELIGQSIQHESRSPDMHYNFGLALATAGRRDQAIESYRNAIKLKPDLVEAYNNLGVALLNAGRLDESLDISRRAVELGPSISAAQNNLGVVLRNKGMIAESIEAHRKAVDIAPQSTGLWSNLGIALQAGGQLDQAIDAFTKALAIDPNNVDALQNSGAIFRLQGRLEQASSSFRKALSLLPDDAQALNNLAAVLIDLQQSDEGIELLRRAIAIKPDSAEAHDNLGIALREKGLFDQAEQQHRKALAIQPIFPQAERNLGNLLQLSGRLDEAIASYRNAVAQKPNFAEALSSLGTALIAKSEVAPGTDAFRQAIAVSPDYALAHFNLSQALLLQGQWLEGWTEQEWRWRARELKLLKPDYAAPMWDGSQLNGQTLFLFAEQGFGDAIHFARYIPLAAKRGARVIIGCQAELAQLFRSVDGVEKVITGNDPLPDFDVQCSLLSLPLVFQTTLENLPAEIPYLHADPKPVEKWRQRIGDERRLKVGLAWSGSPIQKNNRNRSLMLETLAPLADQGVRFFNLQKGAASKQAVIPSAGMELTDWTADLVDFSETAALMENLDLIITVDTSVAHLAGALGRQVWVMLAFMADWRWLLDREDSPWYPTMRLFRQPAIGDWISVVKRVADCLHTLPRLR
ncbi:MAG TPA: tetratricopeptide repeat protein [Tepidisphaeraceae bacterium]|nr:tetratricopeptide repeat protein [Tepidisphaeraceae bacterium]